MIKGIKICGVSNLDTLKFIIEHPFPPHFVGFITSLLPYKSLNSFNNFRHLLPFALFSLLL